MSPSKVPRELLGLPSHSILRWAIPGELPRRTSWKAGTLLCPIELELQTCANAGPGCLDLAFSSAGTISGGFTHPDGAAFVPTYGSADVSVLRLELVWPPAAGQSPDLAAGRFDVRFQGTQGRLYLHGSFALRVHRRFLAC